jgi:hypothetical protein
MKKIILSISFLITSAFVFGQSMIITPNRTQSSGNTSGDNYQAFSNANLIGLSSFRYNGTDDAKTPVQLNNTILQVSGGGYTGPTSIVFDKAIMRFKASENWTSTARGTNIEFNTTLNGSPSSVTNFSILNTGTIGIHGTNALEFGYTVAGKEVNAGKIAYNGFGTSALALVGAGTLNTNRKIHMFAEGGATIDGSLALGIGPGIPIGKVHIKHDNTGFAHLNIETSSSTSQILYSKTGTADNFTQDLIISNGNPAASLFAFTYNAATNPLILTGEGDAFVGRNTTTNGFTRLGSAAPNVKMKELSGTFSASTGTNTNIVHGLTQSKILSVSVLVNAVSGNDVSENYPSWSATGFEFSYFVSSTNVTLSGRSGADGSLLGRPIKILITYKE